MTDPETLDLDAIRAAGVDDWRPMLGRLKALFAAPDLATAVALAGRVAALDEAGSDPVLTLAPRSIAIALGASGVTADVVELARAISAAASELGLTAEPQRIVQLELGLDTARGEHLAPFYAALLGVEVHAGEPVDPSGQLPTLWWQGPGDGGSEPALPEQEFEQRWHFDVWVGPDEGERRLAAVLGAGGRLVSDASAPAFWVVEDADGNRSCICTEQSR